MTSNNVCLNKNKTAQDVRQLSSICPCARILRVLFTFTNFQNDSQNIDFLYLKASDIDDFIFWSSEK